MLPRRTPLKPKKPMARGNGLKRTPMKKVRQKARAGRLKGKELQALRTDCWTLDLGKCRECGCDTVFNGPPGKDDTFEMAHIKAKRIGLDTVDNVKTNCHRCHARFHNWGPSMEKPVPRKEN